ncbi:MAG: ABC transporter permease [Anaerolineae bacterium]|jgi:ABC-2 type transport system permease protein
MSQILLVAGQELWINLRRPGFILMTLLVPALGGLALLLGSLLGSDVEGFLESQFTPQDTVTGYVDHSDLLDAELPQYVGRFIAYPDEALGRGALLAEEIDALVVLPEDYMDSGRVVVYGIGGGFSTFVAADEGDLRSFLVASLLEGKVDAAIRDRALAPMKLETVTLNEKGEESEESAFSLVGDFVLPYAFSILFVMTLFTTSGFLLQGVSEEKEGRIIEILLSSISSTQLLAGKILGLGALGLIQVIVWIGAGAALLSAATAIFAMAGIMKFSLGTIALALVYFVLGYLLFATLMAVAGSMGTTQRESQQIASLFSLAAAIPFMAISFVFTNPHSPLAVALSYIPLTSPVMMLLRLGISDVPPAEIAISLVLLVAGIALSLWAGAKIFRASLLMYGKRPSLRDMARAFSQA